MNGTSFNVNNRRYSKGIFFRLKMVVFFLNNLPELKTYINMLVIRLECLEMTRNYWPQLPLHSKHLSNRSAIEKIQIKQCGGTKMYHTTKTPGFKSKPHHLLAVTLGKLLFYVSVSPSTNWTQWQHPSHSYCECWINTFKDWYTETSLVVQQLRFCLQMQGTQIWLLVRELVSHIPKPVSCNYWTLKLWSPCSATRESLHAQWRVTTAKS